MAKIQSTSACIILLALIACQAILSTQGRQIKSMDKNEGTSSKAILTEGKKVILPPIGWESTDADKDDFRPTTPGNSPGVGHSQHTQDVEFKVVSTAAGHSVGDFRPTSAGHSSAIGHALINKNAEPNA